MISCQFGSWKQVFTDYKAYEPRFHANAAIYKKGLYIKRLAATFSLNKARKCLKLIVDTSLLCSACHHNTIHCHASFVELSSLNLFQ